MDGRALVEQQEQWTANRRFIFLFPSSGAPREISRAPRLAHKAPVMQAILSIERFFNLTKCRKAVVKNSLLIKYAGMQT